MRRYSVASARAKTQLKRALSAKCKDVRLRRLKQVLDLKILDRAEEQSRLLLNLAFAELHALGGQKGDQSQPTQETEPSEPSPAPTPPTDTQKKPQPLQGLVIDAESRGQAPQVEGGYGWIRKANAGTDREARRKISAATREVVKQQGYTLGNKVVQLNHVEEMIKGTKLLSPSVGAWPSSPTTGQLKTKLEVQNGTVLDVAVRAAQAGEHVIAVNAASAYHAGGGFLTGGRHALEEAMCVQSSLYDSLEFGIGLAEAAKVEAPSWSRPAKKKDGSSWMSHLPDDGVLLSPKVEVFRDGTNEGYTFRDTVTVLRGVVSVAMPNCNEKMSDSPVDANPDGEGYKKQLLQKWVAVLTAASSCQEATTLVVPDAGCGVFYNPPEAVGESLGKALQQFRGRFGRVVIAFPGGKAGETFAAAAAAAFPPDGDKS